MKAKGVLTLVVVLLAVIAVVGVVQATNNTLTGTAAQLNGYTYGQTWNLVWKASADTFYMPFQLNKSHISNPHPYQVVVSTSTYNGDSISLAFRLEVSPDNVNWKSYTLGTDSTTWASTKTGTAYLINPVTIIDTSYGGWTPYARIVAHGYRANSVNYNVAGTKAKVVVIDK